MAYYGIFILGHVLIVVGLESVNLQGVSGVYYTPKASKFDDIRCNTDGLTFGLGRTPLDGWDSANNIIESLTCGYITDTYSHLKIQRSLYQ